MDLTIHVDALLSPAPLPARFPGEGWEVVRTEVQISRIAGGFLKVDSSDILRAWQVCHASDHLGTGGFRVWLATIEVRHRRLKTATQSDDWAIDPGEVARLCGITRRRAVALLGRLGDTVAKTTAGPAQVLPDVLSRGGSIALPRRLVRWLLRSKASRSTIAVALASVLRCVSFRRGTFDGRGRISSAWVANAFGVSIRTVKAARRLLEEVGFIASEATQSGWWMATRRHGGVVVVNLEWKPPGQTDRADRTGARLALNVRSEGAGFAPLSNPSLSCETREKPEPSETGFCSEDRDRETASQDRTEAPALTATAELVSTTLATQASGVATATATARPTTATTSPIRVGSTTSTEATTLTPANLADIRSEDFRDTARLLDLFRQAVDRGLLGLSENDRLRFLALAEYAQDIATGIGNPGGLLASLIRKGAWRFATQAHEDRARRRLKAHLWSAPSQPSNPIVIGFGFNPPAPSRPPLSDDARMVREVRRALAQVGFRGDIYLAMRRMDATWTRARWDATLNGG